MNEEEIAPLPSSKLLVKVHSASINPVDIQLWRSGLVGVVAGDKGMGRDFSGTVVAVGSNVKGWKEGDDIFGLLFHVVRLSSRYSVLGFIFLSLFPYLFVSMLSILPPTKRKNSSISK